MLLPSRPELWDHSDPSTHSFRLYFLCDCEDESYENTYPTFVHISTHSEYDLDQPAEFIRQFGRLSLTILEAVKNGYNGDCCIPKLDTFQILASFKDEVVHHQLTPATIGPLIDRSIAYIHKYQSMEKQPKRRSATYPGPIENVFASSFPRGRNQASLSKVAMNTRSNIRSIHSFLRPQNGDIGMGDLNRVLSPMTGRWICKNHASIYSNTEAVEKYVLSHGGCVHKQLSTITIHLDSLFQTVRLE